MLRSLLLVLVLVLVLSVWSTAAAGRLRSAVTTRNP